MKYVHVVKPGSDIHLRELPPDATGSVDRKQGEARAAELAGTLETLQESLYAAAENSVLIVLQGLDTAGKDGTISHVMAHFNPAGCRVESFKVPTPAELAHDFLWRAHAVTPPRGLLTIFNRSYYEDVLAVRVHKLVPRSEWEKRFEQINKFESLLADSGTLILKFFLHISKEEQEKRLIDRQTHAMKGWKLSTSDWPEHALYDDYTKAYEDMVVRCSTEVAPWHIVPADRKWFRNLSVAHTIARVLEPHAARWTASTLKRGEDNIAAARATQKGQPPKGR